MKQLLHGLISRQTLIYTSCFHLRISVDYTRHLDEISRKTELLLLETLQQLFLKSDENKALVLLDYWESYLLLSRNKTQTMEEECKLFLHKCSKLIDIMDRISIVVNEEKKKYLATLKEKADFVHSCVKKEGSLNSGGKFEWVDSVLIKCLQEGSWLLIDNVNLCSAAVLDRLNGLLETNGVLTIAEKGVDQNGQMVEIKPHPSFRLFLTMDPKNGEISRAMRNRGVEIYLLGDETCFTDEYDIKSLINLQGLPDPTHISALLQIHNSISNIILGEKPHLNDILQCSSLISQQMLHGIDDTEAFSTAVIEVYYKSRSPLEFNCVNTVEYIREEVKNKLNADVGSDDSDLYHENVSLKTDKLESCSQLEKIKHQSSVLFYYIAEPRPYFNLISQILINIHTITSCEDFSLRIAFLIAILQNTRYAELSRRFSEIFSKLHVHDRKLPIDFYWNSELPYSVKDETIVHKLNLALLIISDYFQEGLYNNLREAAKERKEIPLLDYMYERIDDKIEDHFNNVIINKYLELMKEYDAELNQLYSKISKVSEDDVMQIVYLMTWKFVFHRVMLDNIKNITPNEVYNLLMNIAVHYKWFYKYAVKKVFDITNVPIPEKLESTLLEINSDLEKRFSFVHKISKNYRKFENIPPPFINENQITAVRTFNEINMLYDTTSPRINAVNVINILKQNGALRKALVDAKCALDYDFSDASTHITLINALHENVVTEEKITKYETEIIPFLDVFLRTMLTSSFVSLGEQCFSNVEVEHNIMVPTELSGLISRYKKDKDPRNLDELFKCFYLYLVNSAAVKPTQYLKEKEDDNVLNVSSFNPLLTCFMSRLLLREDKITPTTLGNFKDLEQQRGIVGTTVWANFEQLAMEKYDFVYCETQILLNNCRSVSLKLAKSLNIENINDDIPLNELIDNCITTLKDKRSSSGASYVETYQSNSSEDLTEDQQIDFLKNKDFLGGQNSDFIEILRMCSSFVKELSTCTNTNEKLLLISNLHIYLSLFKMLLNSKLPVIDPLVKKTLKKKYCSEAIDKFTDIKSGFDVQNGIFCNTDSTHSYRDAAQRFVKRLEEKNENLEKYVAFRPSDVLYSTVLKTIERPFETILSANDVYKVIVSCDIDISPAINAVDTEMPINHEDARRSLAILETAVLNYSNLIEQWKPYSASYPDVIEPLLSSASELLYGVQMKTFLFKKVLMENKNLQIGVDLNKVLVDLVVVPSLNKDQGGYECLIANCTSKKFLKFIDSSLGENKRPEQLRLLNITIQESFNHCIFEANTTNSLNKALFEQFTKLVDIFITAWTTQEEEKELLKEESQSLYKTRTKCEEKPEQEQINDELKQLFPNFHTIDFFDMQKDADFTDQPEESNDNEYTAQISIDDLRNVIRMHTILLTHTKTEWLNPPKTVSSQPDLIQPLVEKYKLFKKILDNSAMCLDYTMDKKLLGSLSLFLYVARKHGDVTDLNEHASPSRLQVNKRRDFYKDPNVEEVKSCCHILDELRLKINQLLEEWPDQPTLKTIETIIDRIYGFSVTSPVARFLTGFELLLSKCNEWEQVAHSGVTLNEFSQRLTHQIIEWRKLELNMWKDLLNITFERLNEPLSKWWLYLYNISKQFIFEKRFTRQDLLETLQTFITKSNLAEFQGRLELLHTFHCHAVYLERTTETEAFISILWNVYSYFLQFGPAVANKIKDLRAPVEKKLKDYVKIVRWKDISYWAIKETVEKSHRTLHKYIREFRELLSQPVSTCLVNIPSSQLSENIGIWDRPQRQYPKTYHYTLDPDSYVTKLSLLKKIEPGFDPSSEILSKLDSYFLRSRKLCKEIISSTEYPGLVQSLETFVVEVIESSSHLQKLEVNTTLPKDKQKSQAKSILQQKQRSLSDLFKNLIKIGISFRAGIVGLKLKNDVDDFLLKPLDLSSSIKHLPHNRTDEKIMTIWDSCEIYYNKSRMRIDVLETALKNPAKDLGIANVERCKGFAAHLSTLIRNQKQQFITSSRLQYYLRYYIHQITEICNGTDFLPKTVITNLTNLLKNIVIVMNQYKLVLSSCPEDKSGSEQVEVILLPGKSSDIQFKHSENWTNAYNSINSILSAATKLSGNLQKYVGHVPSVDCELIAPCFIPVPNLKELENELLKLHETLGNLKQLIGNSNLSDSVLWLMEETVKISNQLEQSPASDPVSTEEFIKTIESCINKVLLVIQNVYKKYSKATNSEESDCREEEEETEYQLMEEHLKIHLMQNLFSDMDLLEMTSVFDAVAQIASIMLTSSPDVLNECRYMTVRCLPLLEQVIQMYQYFVTQQVSCYRVSCKLASVLFNIFIDLVSKGFCTPPEFADDTGKEGESKPSDGLGLGEGEGQRDVSDKIESEDQLEDAQPADKGQEEGEDPDCKEDDNGIEMSEDFDSKLQDKKPEDPDDENGSDEDNSDADEQMGETDKGADQLDEEIWGSDKDEEEGENEGSEETQDKGQVDGPDELGAKESDSKNKKEDKDKGSFEEQDEEQNKKEINEMGDPEYDDEQTDPYHGNQPELPEPEPMDLPDDLQLDDGQEKDSEQPEENPFDIDTMKEQNVPENKDEESAGPEQEEPSKNDEENDFSSDDEDILKTNADNGVEETEEPEKSESESKEKQMEESNLEVEDEENDDEDGLSNEQTGMDQSDTAEQHVEAMEVDNAESKDNVTQPSNSENQKSSQPIDELFQEDNPDNEGVGQSQMEETKSGHTAQTNVAQNLESMGRDVEQEMEKQKPGESDDKRSLGDTSEPVKKKMKTIDSKDTQKEASEMDEEMSMQAPEMYQHIKEAEKETTQILDTATKEQAEQQKEAVQDENETDEETADSSNTLQHEKDEDIDVIDTEQQSSEKLEKMKDSSKNKRQHLEGEVLEEMKDIDVEGETVQTSTVPRGGDSFHHTNYSKLQETTASRLSIEDINTLRGDVEKQLSSWTEPPSSVEAEQAWQKISSVTLSLAQDLSEQLRLVLEPTKTSRLKGDYRTGRRINMRKIIPYIASQFRKDKIWLRRTKPAKREYQIVLAIDDSSSMADNHSKELAFESVALISKALTLLESGQLSVVSFGENIEVLHKLTDQFSEKSGAIFLQKFLFDQQKTCVAKLVDFATEMFNQTQIQSSVLNAKLLVIVSDGRGVFSEGEMYVRDAVRRATLSNVFMVFVIIDNPENKNSVLDIRKPVFKDGKLLGIENYMDEFPFSFYIILKDINSLPSVLSDALRQWFEIVSNLDKQ